MELIEHTPGIWEVYPMLTASENHRGFHIVGVDGSRRVSIGEVSPKCDNDGDPSPEAVANAKLIAAAPDLAKALRPFANFACDTPCDCFNCRARAALRKAGLAAA